MKGFYYPGKGKHPRGKRDNGMVEIGGEGTWGQLGWRISHWGGGSDKHGNVPWEYLGGI